MKRSIAEYLKQGVEGAFFYRMVETVLSRDKNWVRWKIENCPSIARSPVSPSEYVAAKAAARKATTNKRLRPNRLGSLDLKFLSESEVQGGLERLKEPARYRVPSFKSFKSKIELDDMDIDMARDEESKNAAIESKASKSWRALRIASATKLVAFDKIERDDKIDEIFQDNVKTEEPATNGDEESPESEEHPGFPKDRRPIVISGPSGVGKGTLISMLMEKHAKVLGKKASHTTRAPREGEVHGQHYFFVTKAEYDVLRDGDGFLEFNNFNGNDYGTSGKVVEGIIAQGMVPVMGMEMHVSLIYQSFSKRSVTSWYREFSSSRTKILLHVSFSSLPQTSLSYRNDYNKEGRTTRIRLREGSRLRRKSLSRQNSRASMTECLSTMIFQIPTSYWRDTSSTQKTTRPILRYRLK